MIPWRYSPCQREQSTLTQCAVGGDTTGMFGLSMKAWCDAENKDLGYAEMNARESSADVLQCCLGLEVNQTVSSRWITMSRFAGIRFKDCGTTASTARPPTCVLGCGQGLGFFSFLLSSEHSQGWHSGFPCCFSAVLVGNASHTGHKYASKYTWSKPTDRRAIPPSEGFVSH